MTAVTVSSCETMMVKAKARIKNGKLTAKVKYPLVGGARLEVGPTSKLKILVNKLKILVKVPFLFSAKFFGFFKSKKEKVNHGQTGK